MSDSSQETIALPARLDLQTVRPLKDELAGHAGKPVELDAGNVEWVGGLGLQLLFAARRTWDAAGQSLTIANASDAFTEGLRRLGATPDLQTAKES